MAPGRSTPIDLGGGCVLRVPTSAAAVGLGSTDANGALAFGLQIPNDPALVGAEVVLQAVVATSGGPVFGVAELTNGLELTAGF